MSKRNGEITPWSFYKHDAAEMPTQLSNNEIGKEQKQGSSDFQRYEMQKRKKQENKLSFKNFQEINKHNLQKSTQEKKKKKNGVHTKSIDGYCPIVSTSLEMIDVRDEIVLRHEENVILQTLKNILKVEKSEEEARRNKQKYSVMFPTLFTKDSLPTVKSNHTRHLQNRQYPSSQLFNNLISKHAKII